MAGITVLETLAASVPTPATNKNTLYFEAATGRLSYKDDAAAVTTVTTGAGTATGTNTGDQTITLTGDVTGSGTGTFAATIGADKVAVAQMHASTSDVFFGRDSASSGAGEEISASAAAAILGTNVKSIESFIVPCSDEATALTSSGNPKMTFRMPYAFTLTAVRASLTTAQASGSIFTVDINEAGTTILSTKLTIDNTTKTSVGAGTPAVISDASLADDAELTFDIDQVGDGTATGLKVTLIGHRT